MLPIDDKYLFNKYYFINNEKIENLNVYTFLN